MAAACSKIVETLSSSTAGCYALRYANFMSAGCRVVARFRPQSSREVNGRCFKSLSVDTVAFSSPETSNNFTFDRIYDEASSQEDLFQDVRPIVHAVLNGYNGTVLAYGQTGSGKTHTLLGSIEDVSQRGIVPRAIRELSIGISSCKTDCTFQASRALLIAAMEISTRSKSCLLTASLVQVTVSVIEIYCERIRDLLDPGNDNLQVQQERLRGITVAHATEVPVGSEAELVQVMQQGISNRAVASTAMNAGKNPKTFCLPCLCIFVFVRCVYPLYAMANAMCYS
ncbi:TPA: hypothetical protein ACH3X2_011584 [Trebouxia sp. C0005]